MESMMACSCLFETDVLGMWKFFLQMFLSNSVRLTTDRPTLPSPTRMENRLLAGAHGKCGGFVPTGGTWTFQYNMEGKLL
jgi:hypothetical protein